MHKTFLSVLAFGILLGCTSATPPAKPAASSVAIDRSLSADDIDPAIYMAKDDTSDPFREIYVGFRERRARDMADASKPPPIEPFTPVHLTSQRPWGILAEVLPFDWRTLRKDSPAAASQLEAAVKVRLALDHPDVKITQVMIGPGAIIPAHAEGAPGFYYVTGGRGEITVEGQTQSVTPGTTIKLEPYDIRRIHADRDTTLRLLWIRWAPGGDQRYIAAGYYLTGANQHIQPRGSELPKDFLFWNEVYSTAPVSQPASKPLAAAVGSFAEKQTRALRQVREALGSKRILYPQTPTFSHESHSKWLDEEMIKGSGFFWAKDISSLGALLERWEEVMRLKGFFRARRPDGGWDFNISQMVWGPRSRYVEHSHSIPEFYYMLSGPVEHWNGEQKYTAVAGDIFLTNSYQTHQSRGIVEDLPFRNIGASWAPNGDRAVFTRPFYVVEPLSLLPDSAALGQAAKFHPTAE